MDNSKNKTIAIIGAGHMGKSIIQGLVQGGFPRGNLIISNKAEDNKKAAEQADLILIAVKPMQVKAVLKEIADVVRNKIIISAAAALPVAKIVTYAGNPRQKVIRIMPNLPVAYNQGVIGVYANQSVTEAEKEEVSKYLLELGHIFHCSKEENLDVITILSGCGPALVSYCISLLAKAGNSYGLTKEASEKIAAQTFEGTIEYLKQTHQSASELQNAVATKGGVTEQIISSLNKHKIPEVFEESLKVGYDKIENLKEEL